MSTVTISSLFLITMVTISLVIFFTKAFFTFFVIFIGMTTIMTICNMSMSVSSMTVPISTISLVSCKAVGTDQFSDDEVGINVVAHNRPRVVVVLTSIWRCVK